MVLLSEIFDEFLDEAIVDDIAFSCLYVSLAMPGVMRDVVTSYPYRHRLFK